MTLVQMHEAMERTEKETAKQTNRSQKERRTKEGRVRGASYPTTKGATKDGTKTKS